MIDRIILEHNFYVTFIGIKLCHLFLIDRVDT